MASNKKPHIFSNVSNHVTARFSVVAPTPTHCLLFHSFHTLQAVTLESYLPCSLSLYITLSLYLYICLQWSVKIMSAASHWKKAMKFGLSIFGRGFNSSKCKTMAKMTVARIKLLRNKREVVVKQMRRDIALLLQSGQDATARVRVEHVIREQNVMAANEFIELFCDLIVARLQIISKQRECPADLKEGISSLIFAAPRCSDIPELLAIRDIFEKKYGRDFVSAATDLRPNAGVNRMLIEKLSVRTPTGEVKLKVMKEIAKEFQIEWNLAECEKELLKPPEELIDGPHTFISACSMPVNPTLKQSIEPLKPITSNEKNTTTRYGDSASAAEAAAEAAQRAIAAAEVAAYLAKKESNNVNNSSRTSHERKVTHRHSIPGNNFTQHDSPIDSQFPATRTYRSQRFERSEYSTDEDEETTTMPTNVDRKVCRRHSYNVPPKHSDIKFDESDCDEDIEMEEPPPAGGHLKVQPPNRPAPRVPSFSSPSVHPKLPDYDTLAARFEALKHHKSQT